MNPELKETSANLNKSIWYWSPRDFFNSRNAERIKRDERILNSFFNYEHVYRISNLCFDKCVNNFTSTKFVENEMDCLKQCKNKLMSYYSDMTFLDVLQED
jgi:hypothetical protein